MHHTVLNLKLFLLFLPVVLIFAAQFVSKCEKLVIPYARTKMELEYRTWNLPLGHSCAGGGASGDGLLPVLLAFHVVSKYLEVLLLVEVEIKPKKGNVCSLQKKRSNLSWKSSGPQFQ
ncbi:hypothetical protein CRYUN_Cryun35bG0067100 [Craigia yunnanensis]